MVRNWRTGGITALFGVCSLGALATFAQERPNVDFAVAEEIGDSGEVARLTFPPGSGGGIAGVTCTQPGTNCQLPDQVNALNSTGAYAAGVFSGAFRVADDFSVTVAGTVNGLCWWGVYATGGAECAPLPTDAFRVRFYNDLNGRPGTTLLGEHVQGTNMVVTRGTAGALGALTEFEYSATLSGTLFNATANTCFWVEITNNVTGCTWFWETGTGAGAYAAAVQDGDASYGLPDVVNNDQAFCLSRALGNPTNAPCSVTGTGNSNVVETCTAVGALRIPANGTPQVIDLRGTVTEAPSASNPDMCPLETPGPGGVGSVWAAFVATSTRHQISTCSNFGTDTILAVYSGSCAALTQVGCNDDAACGVTGLLSQLCVEGLTIGQTYFVQVRAFDDAARGVYNLTVGQCLDCQAHQPTGGYLIIPSITGVVSCWDDFRPIASGNITTMTLRGTYWNGATGAASRGVEPDFATEIVTMQFWTQGVGNIPDTMIAQRDTISANLTGVSRVDTGFFFDTSGGGFQEDLDAELIDWTYTFDPVALNANTCYWVTVQNETAGPNGEGFRWLAGGLVNMTAGNNRCAFDNENNGVGQDDFLPDDCIFCLDIELDPTVPCNDTTPPPNDECVNAQVVPCTGGAGVQFVAALNNATESGSDPLFSCHPAGPTAGQGSVWYRITTGAGVTSLLVDTCLSDFVGVNDDVMAVYTSATNSCNDLVEVACSDDGCGEAAAYGEIRIDPALPNTTYWVQLAGEDDFAQLSYVIRFRCPAPPAPANDLCSNADALVIGVSEQGTTLDSTFDANADAAGICNTVPVGPKGVWHTVVNPGPATTLEANLCTLTAIDTQVTIFCGPDCNNLTCVTADDDGCGPVGGPSLTSWCAEQGTTYWVYVHNFPGEEGGLYEIVVNDLGGGVCVPTVVCPSAPGCAGDRGDANCDGSINFFDIDPFLQSLFNLPAYLAANCNGSICAVDIDCSNAVDFFDIDPFLNCLFGQPGCGGPLCP